MHLPRQQPPPLRQVGACWPQRTLVHGQVCHLMALLPLSSLPHRKSAPPAGQTSAFAQAAAQAQAEVSCAHVLHQSTATLLTHIAFELRRVTLLMLPCMRTSGQPLGCCSFAVPCLAFLLGFSIGFSTGLWKQRSCKRCGPGTCLPAEGTPSLYLSVHLCC